MGRFEAQTGNPFTERRRFIKSVARITREGKMKGMRGHGPAAVSEFMDLERLLPLSRS